MDLRYVDVGPEGARGFPLDDDYQSNWPQYSEIILPVGGFGVDVVFVDGQFQIACILASLIRSGPDRLIIIQSFWNRPDNHLILDFVEFVDTIDTMVVVRRKDVDMGKILGLYQYYQYIPA